MSSPTAPTPAKAAAPAAPTPAAARPTAAPKQAVPAKKVPAPVEYSSSSSSSSESESEEEDDKKKKPVASKPAPPVTKTAPAGAKALPPKKAPELAEDSSEDEDEHKKPVVSKPAATVAARPSSPKKASAPAEKKDDVPVKKTAAAEAEPAQTVKNTSNKSGRKPKAVRNDGGQHNKAALGRGGKKKKKATPGRSTSGTDSELSDSSPFRKRGVYQRRSSNTVESPARSVYDGRNVRPPNGYEISRYIKCGTKPNPSDIDKALTRLTVELCSHLYDQFCPAFLDICHLLSTSHQVGTSGKSITVFLKDKGKDNFPTNIIGSCNAFVQDAALWGDGTTSTDRKRCYNCHRKNIADLKKWSVEMEEWTKATKECGSVQQDPPTMPEVPELSFLRTDDAIDTVPYRKFHLCTQCMEFPIEQLTREDGTIMTSLEKVEQMKNTKPDGEGIGAIAFCYIKSSAPKEGSTSTMKELIIDLHSPNGGKRRTVFIPMEGGKIPRFEPDVYDTFFCSDMPMSKLRKDFPSITDAEIQSKKDRYKENMVELNAYGICKDKNCACKPARLDGFTFPEKIDNLAEFVETLPKPARTQNLSRMNTLAAGSDSEGGLPHKKPGTSSRRSSSNSTRSMSWIKDREANQSDGEKEPKVATPASDTKPAAPAAAVKKEAAPTPA